METMTVSEALAEGRIPAIDARALLRYVLKCDEAALIAHPGRTLSAAEREAYAGLRGRRAAGEPLAYLVGEREFYSLPFKVTPAVLIPRPETELLVDAALAHVAEDAWCRVLDLGTGSGCLAIAIARHRPRARVTAADVSGAALAVARENARRHAVEIELVESDWLEALAGRRFDLIVANPPYVPSGDPHLGFGDARFEPLAARAGGPDGVDAIRLIVARAGAHLSPGAALWFEHGYDQGARARELLAAAGYTGVRTQRDFAGHERVSGGLTAPAPTR